MPLRSALASFVLLATLFLACAASASDAFAPLPVHLTVQSFGDRCPTRDGFLARLQARSTRIREGQDDETAPTLRVDLETEGEATIGRLRFEPAKGPLAGKTLLRELRGADCESVAAGLALVAVLILDPTASLSPVAPPPLPSAAPTVPAPPLPASTPAPPPPPALTAVPPPGPASVAVSPRPRESSNLGHVAIGGALATAAGVLPNVAVMPRGFLEVELPRPMSLVVVRLSVGHGFAQSVGTSLGTALLTSTDLRLDGCVVPWPGRSWRLGGCGLALAGVLSGEGTRTLAARSADRALVEAGGAVAVKWSVLEPLIVEATAGITAAIYRYRFYFSPDTTAFRVAPVAPFAEIAAGWQIW